MESYCRLCAKIKRDFALKYKLSDVRWILEKCCEWEESGTENVSPQNVCRACFNQLDKSWQFISAVKIAQKQIKVIVAQQRELLQRNDPLDINKIDNDFVAIKHEPIEIDDSINFAVASGSAREVDTTNNSAKCDSTSCDDVGGRFNAGKSHETSEGIAVDSADDDSGDCVGDGGADNCLSDDDCSADGHTENRLSDGKFVEDDLANSSSTNNIGGIKNAAEIAVPKQDIRNRKNSSDEDCGALGKLKNKDADDVKPQNLSQEIAASQKAADSFETKTFETVGVGKRFVEKEEFLSLIPENARLENGEIHPDKIAELNLIDWAEIKFSCWKCNISCDTEKLLRAHFEDKHPKIKFKLSCSICATNKNKPTKDTSNTFKNLQVHITRSHYPHLYHWWVQ